MRFALNGTISASMVALVCAMVAQPAFGQDAEQDVSANDGDQQEASTGFAVITVTARKSQEVAQDLPITISAFSADELESKVVIDVQDLQYVTPGLNVGVNAQGGAPVFAIRGTATQNLIDGGIAVYLDDMPLVSTIGIVNSFYDVSSVEILKGPQGTQFGANTTGGTISVRANKPTDNFEGYVKAGYGNYNRREFEGMVNIPMNDVVKLRVAGNWTKRDGITENLAATGSIPKEFGTQDYYSLRGTLRMEGDNITSDIVADYYKQDQIRNINIPLLFSDTAAGPGTSPADFGAQTGGPGYVYVGPNPSGIEKDHYNKAEIFGIQHQLNWEISDVVSLRNVLGYRDDSVPTSENNGGNSLAQINVLTDFQNQRWVEDLTLSFRLLDDRLRASIGGYYQDTKKNRFVVANAAQSIYLGFTGMPLVSNIRIRDYQTFTSKALYSNVDFDVTDALTIFGGFRYTWDDGSLVFGQASGVGLPDVGMDYTPNAATPCSPEAMAGFPNADLVNCIATRKGSWSDPSWTAGLNYTLDRNVLAYAKVSRGYTSGGFNTTIREVPLFNPEIVTMYEGGLKADWFLADRPIRTNLAVYYSKVKDKQIVQNAPYSDGSQGNGVVNAAKESIFGVDAELRVSPFEGFTFDGSYSYIDAKFDEFVLPALGLLPAVDLTGQTPATVPTHQLSMTADYVLPLDMSVGDVGISFTGYYTSAIRFSNIDNTAGFGEQYESQGGYWLANASLRWNDIAGSRVSARAWVKNLFDKEYAVSRSAQFAPFGYAVANFGEPRTFGGSVTVEF